LEIRRDGWWKTPKYAFLRLSQSVAVLQNPSESKPRLSICHFDDHQILWSARASRATLAYNAGPVKLK
jgi:hypothetical protein